MSRDSCVINRQINNNYQQRINTNGIDMNKNVTNKKVRRNKKVWIEDPFAICDNIDIIPDKNMTKHERINTITRLVFLVFVIMLLARYPYSLNFLALALIIILILYFLNTKEYYGIMDKPTQYRNPLIAQNSQAIRKMAVQPIIVPRAHDREVWSYPSYRHSAVNYNQDKYDVTEEYTTVEQAEDYTDYDPRLSSYTNFTLDRYGDICKPTNNQPISVEQPQQPVNNTPVNSTPIGNVTGPLPPVSSGPSVERFSQQRPINPSLTNQRPINPSLYNQRPVERFQGRSRERFGDVPSEIPSGNTPINTLSTQYQQYQSQNPQPRKMTYVDNTYATIKDLPDNESFVPNQDLLIPKTITSIYGPGEVTQEERIKYLTNIQPNEYSYSDISTPINSNLGISYTPSIPPMVLDQVATPYGTYPLYHRIDPQLVRDQNISPERLEELPRRTAWSAKYSMFDAAPGTVNIEDIYDPRFNGYGDEYRSYGDVNLGQVQYYYSDVDAYRYPNFGIRSKVDFIDYVDPMGKIYPEYDRQVGLNDIKKTVHDQYTSDALYFREGLQERLMKKRNRELWQLREAPIRKDARAGTFTSHY